MTLVLIIAALAAAGLVAVYLSWTAGRLDRLHNRTDAAWASLDAQLVRRAALAAEIAHAASERGLLKPEACEHLGVAAQRALESGPAQRVATENTLGRALRDVLDADALRALAADGSLGAPLSASLTALETAMTKVVLARRFHATAVEDTMTLRRRRAVRWFRLAGSAPYPAYFDIDDTPVPIAASPAPRPD